MKSLLAKRLEAACERDASIVASKSDVSLHQGCSLEYLESLGLTKTDLKRLERAGLAVRARTANGSLVEREGLYYKQFGPGSRVRWILYVG